MKEALKQRADGVEVDIRLSKDNKIVCHHDKNTKRTTGKERLISETTLDELKSLECGSWFGESWKDEAIPELRDVLDLLKNREEIFIEVKTKKEIIPFLMKEIENFNEKLKITVISFYPEIIEGIKAVNKNIQCNWLVAFDYKDITTDEIITTAKAIGANGVGAQNHARVDESMVDNLKDNGLSAHVWTVNDVEEANQYLKIGIDSITTNCPLYLRNKLEKLK